VRGGMGAQVVVFASQESAWAVDASFGSPTG
jgi:hypothetical protein